ncbi:phosphoglucosamine mutase, partial [Microbulbifer sp. OS29]|nr:phosphoglucosamine mutase [Microbulbifer okhotskensis]
MLEELDRRDWFLGAENSGHVVCRHLTSTGDGIVAGLQVLKAMVESGDTLAQLRQGMTKL